MHPHPPLLGQQLVCSSPALGRAYAKRNCLQFCSREKDFSATDKDAPQLNLSLPQRGRGTTVGFPEASVAELWGFALVVDEEVALGRINRL